MKIKIWDDSSGDYQYPTKDYIVNNYTDFISIQSVQPAPNKQSSVEIDITSSDEQHTRFTYSIRYIFLRFESFCLNKTRSYHLSSLRELFQCAHGVVLTSVRRRFNVMDVVWMSKGCRVLTGILSSFDITRYSGHQSMND